VPSTSGPFVRCSAQPAQFAACRPAAGSQLQLRPPRKGRGAGEKGSGGLLHPAMHAGCGALASRVNGGCCRRCGQGGRHARGEGKLMSRFLLLLLPCAPPCQHPLLHSRHFLLVQAEASPLLSPSGARTPQRRMLLALAALAAAGTTPSRVLSVWLYTCGFQLLYAGAGCIGLGNPPQQCSL
jgi:hypothetical protein